MAQLSQPAQGSRLGQDAQRAQNRLCRPLFRHELVRSRAPETCRPAASTDLEAKKEAQPLRRPSLYRLLALTLTVVSSGRYAHCFLCTPLLNGTEVDTDNDNSIGIINTELQCSLNDVYPGEMHLDFPCAVLLSLSHFLVLKLRLQRSSDAFACAADAVGRHQGLFATLSCGECTLTA